MEEADQAWDFEFSFAVRLLSFGLGTVVFLACAILWCRNYTFFVTVITH